MRETLNQRSLSLGELSPSLFGRTDVPKYLTALKKARGVMFDKRGVLYNHPGSETIMPGKFPTKTTRQIPFKFSFNQQFELIFGDKYIHIIENGVPVWNFTTAPQVTLFPNGATPTITMAGGSASSTPVTGAQIANGMLVQLQPYGIPSFLQNSPVISGDFSLYAYNRWFIVQNVSIGSATTTFTLTDLYGNQIDSTAWGTYSGNLQIQTVYEVVTPYAYTDLALLKTAGSFDVVQIRHHLYQRYQLERFANNNWILTINTAWPSQSQLCNNMNATGGLAGNVNYYYKFTTYNLTTRLESLPCPAITFSSTVQSLITSVVGLGAFAPLLANVTVASASGFHIGQYINFSSAVVNTNTTPQTVFTTGVSYQIVNIAGNVITVQALGPAMPTATNTFYTGAYVYLPNGSNTNQIASFTNSNGVVLVTSTANHGLINGQEVNFQGTGVYGFDGLNFNVTVQSATTFTVNGAFFANYNFTNFVSSTSTLVAPTAVILSQATPTIADPVTLRGSLTNPGGYSTNIIFNIYASTALNSGYGFIGSAIPAALSTTFTFLDQGIPPDPTLSPIQYIPLFLGTGNFPAGCSYYQQRLCEFGSDNNPQGLWASVIGDYNNFTIHDPIQENDAIILDIASNELGQIFDSAEDGFLILMTDMGPMVCAGDQTGVFSPSSNLIKRQMFAGASQQPRPLTIFKNVVYLEANQGAMRDLEILVTPYYTYISASTDISIYSGHLLTASPVLIWDYKQYPDSQIYSVRKDGIMVLTTYFKEQEIQAFSWLDTVGTFLDVNAVQEGTETAVYTTAQRASGPWIERFASRYYKDPTIDAVFTHATDSYNGLVNGGTTAVLSGGTLAQSVVTATLSTAIGASFQAGWQVNFKLKYSVTGPTGYVTNYYSIARVKVTSTTANTIVGTLFEAINPLLLGRTISDIRVASNVVGGLWHLNGQNVSVVGDGFVHANPNDNASQVVTVVNGSITLPRAFGVINVGLPYLSDVQTLDIDETKGETFMDKKIAVKRVTLKLLDTADVWAGPNFTECLKPGTFMDHPKLRDEEGYDQTTNLFTGIIQINMDARYGFGGSFALRNSQPLPMCLLSVAPLIEVQTG